LKRRVIKKVDRPAEFRLFKLCGTACFWIEEIPPCDLKRATCSQFVEVAF
jgi:hypothetical protein